MAVSSTTSRELREIRPRRVVVLHADDFGMNRPVTDGIIRGFTDGLLTSTSLLANAPDAKRALAQWRRLEVLQRAGRLPSASSRTLLGEPVVPFELGIHLNLTQGRPLTRTYPGALLDASGSFCGIGILFRHLGGGARKSPFESALRQELAAQIEWMIDHGFPPTHLNGHQYVELLPGLSDTIGGLLARYRIGTLRVARESGLFGTTLAHEKNPRNWVLAHVKRFYAGRLLRAVRRWDVDFPDAFFGTSHAGRVDCQLVRFFLDSGFRGRGVRRGDLPGRGFGARLIEIGLHPACAAEGKADNGSALAAWHDPLAAERPKELEMLMSPLLVELLESRGVSLGRLAKSMGLITRRAA